jgi:cytochrome P450
VLCADYELQFPQGVVTLMQNPSQLDELKADPTLVPGFVEELCRYHTGSSMAMKRVAKEDMELGGQVSIMRGCVRNCIGEGGAILLTR